MSSSQQPHHTAQDKPPSSPASEPHDADEPTTPRAVLSGQQPRRDRDRDRDQDQDQDQDNDRRTSSGSETEREASHHKGKRKKHKGKEKAIHGMRRDRDSPSSSTSTSQTCSDPQPPDSMLSSRSTKPPSSSSSISSSSRRPAGKAKKSDDWSEVTDPDERRRIQNRIAQRKFREKAREQKERVERESRNQEHAASSYQVPVPDDLGTDEQLSGVPWGGPSFRFMLAKGHESMSSGSGSGGGSGGGSHRGGGSHSGGGGGGGGGGGSSSFFGSGSTSTSTSCATPDYVFDDAATAIYSGGDTTAVATGMVPAADPATTDAYYYPSHEAYSYGGSASASTSDFADAAASQDNQFYDDGSFYYDYES